MKKTHQKIHNHVRRKERQANVCISSTAVDRSRKTSRSMLVATLPVANSHLTKRWLICLGRASGGWEGVHWTGTSANNFIPTRCAACRWWQFACKPNGCYLLVRNLASWKIWTVVFRGQLVLDWQIWRSNRPLIEPWIFFWGSQGLWLSLKHFSRVEQASILTLNIFLRFKRPLIEPKIFFWDPIGLSLKLKYFSDV